MLNSRMLFFMYLSALGVGVSSVVSSHALLEQGISAGAKVDVIGVSAVDQALFDAIAVGDASDAEKALDSGANKNAVDEYGDSALHRASNNGSIEIVQLLLDKGGKVNARNKHGNTPLHRAISAGHLKIAELLLKKGANINARGILGRTPLQVAVSRKFSSGRSELIASETKTIKWLIDNESSLSASDDAGKTALHLAVEFGDLVAVQMLIDKGADINAVDHRGSTPMHIAASRGRTEMVELLLKNNASMSIRDKKGNRPYRTISDDKQKEIIRLFKDEKKRRMAKALKKASNTEKSNDIITERDNEQLTTSLAG